MAKFGKQELWQAASCVLCLAVAWIRLDDIGSSEFSGGWLTGPIFLMADAGSDFFIPAMILAFFYRRIAAGIAFVACLLCLPLYLYFIAPGPFRWIFKGEYSVSLRANFYYNNWAIAGIISIVVAVFVHLRSFSAIKMKIKPTPEHEETQ
jgi:Na+(H+)/acetate symporter ActP